MTCPTGPSNRSVPVVALACALTMAVASAGGGCSSGTKNKPIGSAYRNLGPKKNLPKYLKGSIYEMVELANQEPFPVSAFGLVGQLRGTGDTDAPPAVRQWMIK